MYKAFDFVKIGFLVLQNENCIYINEYLRNYFCNHEITLNLVIESVYKDDYINLNIEENTCRIYNNSLEMYRWMKIIKNDNKDCIIYSFEDIHEYLNNSSLFVNFFSNLNHTLRTPINGIVGMIYLLDSTKLNKEQKDYINMLSECSVNLISIINDIIDISKLEYDKMILDIKCNDLREIIQSVDDIINTKLEKNVKFSFNIQSNVPNKILIDSDRLKQVLLNLLYNSVKFTSKGFIKLNITRENEKIKFEIIDTGCGIDNKDKNKIFKNFEQINVCEGTGLGLSISRKLVKLMNGELILDSSNINIGSIFCFTIGCVICDMIIKKTVINYNYNVFKDKKVFILDDNRDNRFVISSIIQNLGCEVQTFTNGKEALYFLKNKTFHLGLVDIYMPEMDGKEFALNLSEQNKLLYKSNIPLVALVSSLDDFKDYKKHFVSSLVKPINAEFLKKACFDVLNTFIVQKNIVLKKNITNVRILLVEDSVINQKIVLKFLHKLNFNNVDIVDNGKKCLDILTKYHFDLILLDIRIPEINGELVFEYINSYYNNFCLSTEYKFVNNTKPYIIAITSLSLQEDREKFLYMGFDDYISKPVNMFTLDNCLNKYLEQ